MKDEKSSLVLVIHLFFSDPKQARTEKWFSRVKLQISF